jgi:hypothetical protein
MKHANNTNGFGPCRRKLTLECTYPHELWQFLLAHAGKDEAKKYFEKAIKIADVMENDFIAMECTRLLGQLSESKITGSAKQWIII